MGGRVISSIPEPTFMAGAPSPTNSHDSRRDPDGKQDGRVHEPTGTRGPHQEPGKRLSRRRRSRRRLPGWQHQGRDKRPIRKFPPQATPAHRRHPERIKDHIPLHIVSTEVGPSNLEAFQRFTPAKRGPKAARVSIIRYSPPQSWFAQIS